MVVENKMWSFKNLISTKTRRCTGRCRCAGGHVFPTEIYTVIDMETDVDVLLKVTASGMQSVPCPKCNIECHIAEPFAIHDPENERYALYIPEMLSHRELFFRSGLLSCIAEIDGNDIPAYVGDFQTILGSSALIRWKDELLSQPGERVSKLPVNLIDQNNTVESSDKTGKQPADNSPAIHEAFADLALRDSSPPSYPPEPEQEEEEDWLDNEALGSTWKRLKRGTFSKIRPADSPGLDTGRKSTQSTQPPLTTAPNGVSLSKSDKMFISNRPQGNKKV